jgi:DNA-binding transcriptional ArsR family regulator
MQRKGLAAEDRLGAVPLFAALGDPVRLAMIARLCDSGPLPTIELKQAAGVSRQAITKHLQVLESAGLVRSERVGRDRQWRMQARQLAVARRYLDQISKQWDQRLERLKVFVEGDPAVTGSHRSSAARR